MEELWQTKWRLRNEINKENNMSTPAKTIFENGKIHFTKLPKNHTISEEILHFSLQASYFSNAGYLKLREI